MIKVVIDTNVFISAFYLPESRPAEIVLLARRKTSMIWSKIQRMATGASDEGMVVDHFGGFDESGWLRRGF